MESYNNNDERKSRDQKFNEYFIILQKEYIVAELRKKIYPDITGKEKSREIMAGKVKKIKDIAIRNSLKTIFPDFKLGLVSLFDEGLRIKLYKEIYGSGGLPKFIYRDETQKLKLGYKDKKCYFMVGSEVKCPEGIGSLQIVDLNTDICYVKVNGEAFKYNLDEIQRIL